MANPETPTRSLEDTRAQRRRTQVGVAVSIVFLAFFALLLYALLTRSPLTSGSGSQRPGNPAPAFALASLGSGEIVSLSDFAGQPIVVNFWASWCAPCRLEMPHLVGTFQQQGDSGVVFIGIDVQDTESDAQSFLEEFNVPVQDGYIILVDESGGTTIDYGVSGLPATFFIDRDGVVVKRWVGAVNGDLLNENIALITGSVLTP